MCTVTDNETDEENINTLTLEDFKDFSLVISAEGQVQAPIGLFIDYKDKCISVNF